MAIYRNGEIYKGPSNVSENILSDTKKINKGIEDYILLASKAQTLLESIYKVADSYGIDSDAKVRLIKSLTGQEGE